MIEQIPGENILRLNKVFEPDGRFCYITRGVGPYYKRLYDWLRQQEYEWEWDNYPAHYFRLKDPEREAEMEREFADHVRIIHEPDWGQLASDVRAGR